MKKLDEAIERFNHNAEYERTNGNLQGCLEFKQLAKWLKELRAYREMYRKEHADDYLRSESDENELRKYAAKVINRGNCMMCGKKLTEGLFFCKECEEKGRK